MRDKYVSRRNYDEEEVKRNIFLKLVKSVRRKQGISWQKERIPRQSSPSTATKKLSVYKPVSACSGNASVFYQF